MSSNTNITLLEYLERDRERFLNALADAGTVDRCAPVIADETDRLLLRYNEKCEDPAKREAAAYMLQTARLSASLADTVGEVNIREKINYTDEKNMIPFRAKLLLLGSAGCGIFSLVIAFLNSVDHYRVTDMLLAVILAVFSVTSGVFAGKMTGTGIGTGIGSGIQGGRGTGTGSGIRRGSRTGTEIGIGVGSGAGRRNLPAMKTSGAARRASAAGSGDISIEKRIDIQKVYTDLHNLVYAIDRNLDNLSMSRENAGAYGYYRGGGIASGTRTPGGISAAGGGLLSGETAAGGGLMSGTTAAGGGLLSGETAAGGGLMSGDSASTYAASSSGLISEQERELFAGLLESSYSGDSAYILDQIHDVKLYLHRNGIETVDYDGKNGDLFDFLPVQDQAQHAPKTIRPAMTADGRLLKRGLAAGAR